jgi:hypothetical protein
VFIFLLVSEGLKIIDAKKQAMDPISPSKFRYLKAKYLITIRFTYIALRNTRKGNKDVNK